MIAKPTYRVPSMAEIAATEPNRFTVASTFSGCGGSSLGYRMAGFRVLWANEFVDAARETYKANAADYTTVDGRDIRTVKPEDILAATGLKAGELDLFDGSPPCASFSTAGKRAKLWGKVKKYSDREQRTDDLFHEYVRLLRGLRPKTFVAENVAGMVRGVAKGVFIEVITALKDCGYRVSARVLDGQWLGIPQARQRLIFVGVREDLGLDPVHPKPLPYNFTIRDALPWLAGIGTNKGVISADQPCPTILTHGNRYTQSERTAIDAPPVEPEADITRFAIGREWDVMGKPGTQSTRYFQLRRPSLDQACPTITAEAGNTGAAGVTHPTERRKFSIGELKRLCGFPDDFVLTGTYRQQWERLGRAVPPVMMCHIAAAIRDGVLRRIAK
ncbi:MAG TPA: DNA cytosine methyltransferase [Tepidisphaeraceae bacterium]|nr:DNA cytosine methyltransferase [Tepidisphaeraceae bacterium]